MYDQFYGLEGRPFQLTPDPRFYFESATHRKALSYLGYGLAQGEGFIVITGEVGAGKSILVAHLMATIDKKRLTAANIVTTQLERDELLEMVAANFGLQVAGLDKPQILKRIEGFLHEEARAGRRCLLVVDEAQNLPVDSLEELRMLSNFQLGSTPLLQIFLLGQPEFRDMVCDGEGLEQLRQRIIANHHLEPMEAEEIEPYIVHRLAKVGWTGANPEFDAEIFAQLHAETGGVPRKLNTLINRVLLMGSVEQVKRIDTDLVKAVLADLRGEPFDYEAPLTSRMSHGAEAELEEREPEPQAVEDLPEAVEETAPEPVEESEPDPVEPEESFAALAAVAPVATVSEEAEDDEPVLERENGDPSDEEDASPIEFPASAGSVPIEDFQLAIERICGLEERVAEQQATLRRILAIMVDWVEHDMDGQKAA